MFWASRFAQKKPRFRGFFCGSRRAVRSSPFAGSACFGASASIALARRFAPLRGL